MKRGFRVVGTALGVSATALLGVGCSGGGVCDNAAVEGYRTLEQDGTTREYILHVPASYDASSPDPSSLVLVFHGNGQCASNFTSAESGASMDAIGDDQNALIAYPQGLIRGKGAAEFDPTASESTDIAESDLAFVDAILADIQAEYTVDPERIYAAGYSNGGMMTYGLACHRGDVFGAFGIMSGIMLTDTTCNAAHTPSIVHFHGTSDFAIPYDGSGNFPAVADTINFWLGHNGLSSENLETTALDNGSVTRDAYTSGTNGSSVVLYTIDEGDHIWFEDPIGGQSPNAILWEFLSGG